jgi:hypothetical protein
MKTQWNLIYYFHINILPQTPCSVKVTSPSCTEIKISGDWKFWFLLQGVKYPWDMLSFGLKVKKYQDRAIKFPHNKRNVKHVFKGRIHLLWCGNVITWKWMETEEARKSLPVSQHREACGYLKCHSVGTVFCEEWNYSQGAFILNFV